MTNLKPRLIEARWTFQVVVADDEPEIEQFSVRIFRRGDRLRMAFDIHGDGPGVENVPVAVLDAIRAAAEIVGGRVKLTDIHEQHE